MERLSNIQQINQSIMFGDFTNDQLNSILAAVKFRRGQISREVKRELRPGINVSFVSSRSGAKIMGKVRKVNIKYVIVDTPAGGYRVPASMLNIEV